MAELITRSASGSVAEVVERLLAALERGSITVFERAYEIQNAALATTLEYAL
jgi:hypothetical protein